MRRLAKLVATVNPSGSRGLPVCAAPVTLALLTLVGALPAAAWPVLSGPYFGQKPPGLRAEMFAPGIVSSEHHDDGPPAFSPDGRECFWRVNGYHDGTSRTGKIFWSREQNGRWTEPRLAPFSSTYVEWGLCMQPDGRRLYFWSRRPRPGDRSESDGGPWFVDRTASGWSEPRPLSLPVDPRRLGFIFSPGAGGALYCVLEDPGKAAAGTAIFRMRRTGDGFASPEPMGVIPVGADQAGAPSFSPDGNTAVFTTDAKGGLELAASFRKTDGTWTAPRPLGDDINAPPQTKFAGFSPDGRYLFVVSNRVSPSANPPKLWKSDVFRGPQREPLCDVYWVDAKALEALRPAQH